MKFQNIICSVILASSFAACSQMEEDLAAGLDPASGAAGNAAFIGGDSEVEIRLSSGATATKTKIYTPDDGSNNFETTDGIGVFMLANQITTVNPAANPILWRAYNEGDNHAKTIVLHNVKANAKINSNNTTDIVWEDGATRYYPIDNWYAFRFYGYHPYQDVGTIPTEDNQRITVTFPADSINGTCDIIYGQSLTSEGESSDMTYSRYSARYMRNTGTADLPVIAFKHSLMAFQFQIQALPDYDSSYDEAHKLTIKSLTVSEIPSGDATLTIANRLKPRANNDTSVPQDENDEGYLWFDWSQLDKKLSVKSGDSEDLNMPITVTGTEKQVCGDQLLLPVPPTDLTINGDHHYRVGINMIYDDGSPEGKEFKTEVPIQLHFVDENNNPVAFKGGCRYNVTLQIGGPQQIQVQATLTDWAEGGDFNPIELN